MILAGGSGTRLWPLSRQQLPKQFLRLNGERSLLEETVERLRPLIEPNQVMVVTNEGHARGEAYHTLLPFRTLLEPVGRNTAPAIAVAAALLLDEGADPVMVVLPADHVIRDVPAFQRALGSAVDAAAAGRLVTFGLRPDRPETGFGYIKAGAGSGPALPVERFIEKPNLPTAERFLAEGGYYWNSGMFVWRASVILAEIERHLPEVARVLAELRAAWKQGGDAAAAMKAHFPEMPSVSIDYGVLEKTDNVVLVPCDIGWSDVGSWDAIHDIADKDERGNAFQGNVLALDCANTLIRGGKRLIAAIGLEDLCIVETPDAILISRRGESQRVREVVDALAARKSTEHIEHVTSQRPWGSYTVLDDESEKFKIKRIEVRPGARLSLQRHQHRSEHWVVVSGTATVTRGEAVEIVAKNESTYIPIGVKHRLENRGKVPLQIIEVQVGEYVGEDDIERFDDQYGRTD
ncbi:MAG TPA: mannose-1-phosphate guanylyltransferase/mannose-6-phosphate isomerase [Burkholderiales bacterium]|nr:mannose-1-phosphate guanylyltransferase/mannose-6-phosphate isomerase [Burkholderiales bacterium]